MDPRTADPRTADRRVEGRRMTTTDRATTPTRVAAAVAARRDRALEASARIHAEPELALEEHSAAELLSGWLEDDGFSVEHGVAGLPTAFVGTWGSGSPTIAIMAEYDALPGVGHACGHNLIASGGLLAATALRQVMEEQSIPGTLMLVGTPGEEGAGGKVVEIEAGVFDGVDAAIMFHPADRTILTRRMLAALHLDVRFHGLAAHAAKNPQDGRNALAAMIQFYVAVDALRQHAGDDARVHGVITNGGAAPNIVPDLTEARFIVRDVTLDRALALAERVRACAQGAALATGTTVEFEDSTPPYAHLNSNAVMAERLGEHLAGLGFPAEPPSANDGTGSTDAGNVSLLLPTIHPFIQTAPRGTPGHSHAFREAAISPQAQEAMLAMGEAMAATALDLFTTPELLAAARAEFDAGAAAR